MIITFGTFMVKQLPAFGCNLLKFENVIKINNKQKYKP